MRCRTGIRDNDGFHKYDSNKKKFQTEIFMVSVPFYNNLGAITKNYKKGFFGWRRKRVDFISSKIEGEIWRHPTRVAFWGWDSDCCRKVDDIEFERERRWRNHARATSGGLLGGIGHRFHAGHQSLISTHIVQEIFGFNVAGSPVIRLLHNSGSGSCSCD